MCIRVRYIHTFKFYRELKSQLYGIYTELCNKPYQLNYEKEVTTGVVASGLQCRPLVPCNGLTLPFGKILYRKHRKQLSVCGYEDVISDIKVCFKL